MIEENPSYQPVSLSPLIALLKKGENLLKSTNTGSPETVLPDGIKCPVRGSFSFPYRLQNVGEGRKAAAFILISGEEGLLFRNRRKLPTLVTVGKTLKFGI